MTKPSQPDAARTGRSRLRRVTARIGAAVQAMVADHMPPSIRRSMLGGRMDINEGNRARYAASADALVALMKAMSDGYWVE